jgi:hypothetical protein
MGSSGSALVLVSLLSLHVLGQVWDDAKCDFIALYSSSVYARQSSIASTLVNTSKTGSGVLSAYSSAGYIHVNDGSSNSLLTSSDYGITWSTKPYTMQIRYCHNCAMVRDASGQYLAAYISRHLLVLGFSSRPIMEKPGRRLHPLQRSFGTA